MSRHETLTLACQTVMQLAREISNLSGCVNLVCASMCSVAFIGNLKNASRDLPQGSGKRAAF